MATGFIARNCSALALLLAAAPAFAVDVSLIGVFGDKAAVLVIDGAAPRTVKVGQKAGPVSVISVERDSAVIEVDGARRVLARGQHYRSAAPADARQSAVLAADPRGHFTVEGSINGGSVRFLVDTGATVIALPQADAERLGINYRSGKPATMLTANGATFAWRVKLDQVRVGDIELQAVDAVVMEGRGLNITLLGMSFLNRVEMRHEGQVMTLTRRF